MLSYFFHSRPQRPRMLRAALRTIAAAPIFRGHPRMSLLGKGPGALQRQAARIRLRRSITAAGPF
ncbi:hypothetical protein ACEN8K_29765, partial [Variovorax sp. CT11-76]